LTLVLDASVVVRAVQARAGFDFFDDEDLVAPPFMWSEARSAVHEAVWRGAASGEHGRRALDALETAPIRSRTHRRLGYEAWRIADEMGWAKTYDAEYVALAGLLGCRMITIDGPLLRRVVHLGFVIGPHQL